jgi:UPF0176 protein
VKVVSFYQFLDLPDPETLRGELQTFCEQRELLGTVLLADEGFNGTLAGEAGAVQAVFDFLRESLKLSNVIDARWTDAEQAPFRRMRVKIKNEIVTLGRADIKPHKQTGKHVLAEEWNALISDPETLVIDTRNHYEVEVGTFPGALDPGNDSFREFPEFAEKLAEGGTNRPLAMFCTGGIRCEKATALMIELGYNDVYQLQGGILSYLEQTKEGENLWDGECFVFDSRVAVDRDLAEGGYVQCHACRRPLTSEDIASAEFVKGISCPKCINEDKSRRQDPESARSRAV